MERQITAYLHIGDKLLPKSFTTLPRMGEIIDAGPYGKLAVVRVEHDQEGEPHLYVSSLTEYAGCEIYLANPRDRQWTVRVMCGEFVATVGPFPSEQIALDQARRLIDERLAVPPSSSLDPDT